MESAPSDQAANTEPGRPFSVIGIRLEEDSRRKVLAAFPRSVFYADGLNEEKAAYRRCLMGDRVTVFVDVEATGGKVLPRTSLHFDQATVKLIGLCAVCSSDIYDAVLRAELSGAIAVDSDVATYRRAAAAVQRGELWLSREYLSKLTRQLLSAPEKLGLSPRELAILKLLMEDRNNQEIADRLFISRETVRWHLKSLYAKLGVSNRASARRFAKNILSPT